jgi:hypothetical protein
MSEERKDAELVDHPAHYNWSKYEHEVIVRNWQLGYHLACCTKYLMRRNQKGAALLDLKKARWYIDKAIEHPYCAFVTFWRSNESERIPAREVAVDWAGDDMLIRTAIMNIGVAVFQTGDGLLTLDDGLLGLDAARRLIDMRIKWLKEKSSSA